MTVPKEERNPMTQDQGLAGLLGRWRTEEDRRHKLAWELHAKRKLENGSYELGYAHALKAAADSVKALISKSSESGEGDRASRSQPKSTLHGAHTDAEPSGQ